MVVTRFAASRTPRCWVADCRAISSGPHNSPRVWPFRSRSLSSRARRVGSARALKTASSSPTRQLCRYSPAYVNEALGQPPLLAGPRSQLTTLLAGHGDRVGRELHVRAGPGVRRAPSEHEDVPHERDLGHRADAD